MTINQLKTQHLKETLFDIFFNGQATTSHDYFALFLEELSIHFTAKIVTLYSHNDYYNTFTPEISTSQYLLDHISDFIISESNSIYGFVKDNKVDVQYYNTYQTIYLPLQTENCTYKLLSLQIPFENIEKDIEGNQCSIATWNELALLCSKFIKKTNEIVHLSYDKRRFEQLYRITSKFHSSMNTDDVLKEVIQTLREVYPQYTYFLLLSHDNNNLDDLPIMEIQYDDSNTPATQAYVTGEMQLTESLADGSSSLFVSLKGKQGIYGVLQVNALHSLQFPKKEIHFITMLANTAGTALENANLYQQSKRFITDLQLINETSRQLNSNLRLSEAMSFMSGQIIESFGAEEVGFILLEKDTSTKVLPGSTEFFSSNNSLDFIKYVIEKVKLEEDSIFIGDLSIVSSIKEIEFRSLMAVPMVESGNLRGVSIVLHKEAYHFSFETFKLLQALIHHSTLALSNSMLHEELEKLVITDNLTKLHSRAHLNECIKKSMNLDAYGTFLLIDIDNFKLVNDRFGHQVGDEVLKQVASVIKDNIRDFDTGARWGGEELAIYLPRVDLSSGVAVAERLVQKVEQITNPTITISCGVGNWTTGKADNPITLFKLADEALYQAKTSGKNRVCIQRVPS